MDRLEGEPRPQIPAISEDDTELADLVVEVLIARPARARWSR
jgi:hypothetical protein